MHGAVAQADKPKRVYQKRKSKEPGAAATATAVAAATAPAGPGFGSLTALMTDPSAAATHQAGISQAAAAGGGGLAGPAYPAQPAPGQSTPGPGDKAKGPTSKPGGAPKAGSKGKPSKGPDGPSTGSKRARGDDDDDGFDVLRGIVDEEAEQLELGVGAAGVADFAPLAAQVWAAPCAICCLQRPDPTPTMMERSACNASAIRGARCTNASTNHVCNLARISMVTCECGAVERLCSPTRAKAAPRASWLCVLTSAGGVCSE